MKYRPMAAVINPMSKSQEIRPKETSGLFNPGVTASVVILFIRFQPKYASGISHSIQTHPALASQVSDPAIIRLNMVPLLLFKIMDPPLKAPNMGNVMTNGINICIVVTPKFPKPAFIPKA